MCILLRFLSDKIDCIKRKNNNKIFEIVYFLPNPYYRCDHFPIHKTNNKDQQIKNILINFIFLLIDDSISNP